MKNEKVQARRSRQKHLALKKGTVVKSHGATTTTEEVANILGRAPIVTLPAQRIPAKWRWVYRGLLALQSRLMRDRGELLRAAAQPIEPHSMDEADSATDEFDHDLALTQLSVEQNALYEVNRALQRIAEGTYGICEETGQPIPAARLRAVPWTRFTREAEERLEKEGVVSRAHLPNAASVRDHGKIRLTSEEQAEEAGEKPLSPPNDEALPHVFSPSGRCAPLPKIDKRSAQRSDNPVTPGPITPNLTRP